MTKRCTKCKVTKALTEYKYHPKAKDNKASWCKDCSNKASLNYYYKHKERILPKMRNNNLIKNYGIDQAEYDKMLIEQDGKCMICLKHHTAIEYPLCVDHDHNTGVVRGLLCMNCNTIIGHAHDDVTILESAIKFLNKRR